MWPFTSSSTLPPRVPPSPSKLKLQPHESLTYALSSARTLGYAVYGSTSPASRVIFFFHGMPGSRICGRSWNKLCHRLDVRLICIDRPGYGLSTPSTRCLTDWPSDVLSLADHLHIDKFSVIGGSAGGPFALACARFIPSTRLRGTTVVCGIGPLDAIVPFGWRWAKWLVGVIARHLVLPRVLAPYANQDSQGLKRVLEDQCVTEEEKAFIYQEAKEGDLDDAVVQFLEAFRQGDGGARLDGKILTSDWGFDVGEVKNKEKVWLLHGDQDRIAPLGYAEWIDGRLGGGRLKVLKGMTHSTIWKEGEEEIFRQSAEA
jgi:pimeloyl-ACP methyl ester carboxylesterase